MGAPPICVAAGEQAANSVAANKVVLMSKRLVFMVLLRLNSCCTQPKPNGVDGLDKELRKF
jgi:hypothetical protein